MLAPGGSLGEYTLLKHIAQGGMGEIFLASKFESGAFSSPVVLKVLKEELARDTKFVDMLVDEANITRALQHPNIVSVLDFGQDQGTVYIAMEYVHGTTLEKLLEAYRARGVRLDLPIALHVSARLADALGYAHTQVTSTGQPLDIVHRDVTPGNVLVSVDGEVKLTDFGLARATGRVTHTMPGVLKGRFGYMAPEMLKYEPVDARADVFAAGIVMYEMLTGARPGAGASMVDLVQILEQRSYPTPTQANDHVPPALDEIIMRALESSPAARWSSAAELGASVVDLVQRWGTTWPDALSGGPRLVQAVAALFPELTQPPISESDLDDLVQMRSRAAMFEEDVIDRDVSSDSWDDRDDATMIRPDLLDASVGAVGLTGPAGLMHAPVPVSELRLTGTGSGGSLPAGLSSVAPADPASQPPTGEAASAAPEASVAGSVAPDASAVGTSAEGVTATPAALSPTADVQPPPADNLLREDPLPTGEAASSEDAEVDESVEVGLDDIEISTDDFGGGEDPHGAATLGGFVASVSPAAQAASTPAPAEHRSQAELAGGPESQPVPPTAPSRSALADIPSSPSDSLPVGADATGAGSASSIPLDAEATLSANTNEMPALAQAASDNEEGNQTLIDVKLSASDVQAAVAAIEVVDEPSDDRVSSALDRSLSEIASGDAPLEDPADASALVSEALEDAPETETAQTPTAVLPAVQPPPDGGAEVQDAFAPLVSNEIKDPSGGIEAPAILSTLGQVSSKPAEQLDQFDSSTLRPGALDELLNSSPGVVLGGALDDDMAEAETYQPGQGLEDLAPDADEGDIEDDDGLDVTARQLASLSSPGETSEDLPSMLGSVEEGLDHGASDASWPSEDTATDADTGPSAASEISPFAVRRKLLPEVPSVSGWELAAVTRVARDAPGGDVHDFVVREDGCVEQIIATVSDAEYPGGVFTAKCYGLMRAAFALTDGPGEGVAALAKLLAQGKGDSAVTVCSARLDAGSFDVRYINAGHPPPLLYRGDVDKLFSLVATGDPLTNRGSGKVEEKSVHLGAGDFLVMFGDGVVNATNGAGESYGWVRLQALLQQRKSDSAAMIAGAVEQAVREFMGPLDLESDVSVVVARRPSS